MSIVDEGVRRFRAGECTFDQLCERMVDMATPGTAAEMLEQLPEDLRSQFEWWLIAVDGTSLRRKQFLYIGSWQWKEQGREENRKRRNREAFSRAILERREPV